jgi:hypothetical protein
MWYNEEDLAPFFLSHYSWVDEIRILIDTDTTDRTVDLLRKHPNVKIYPFSFPDGMDDWLKIMAINDAANDLPTDWRLAVDADEFVFTSDGSSPKQRLEEAIGDLIVCIFYQVYRHISDTDLDPCNPSILQRRHGDPNIVSGINAMYCKPCLVRNGIKIAWGPGCHHIENHDLSVGGPAWDGAHWAMADPALAIKRRIYGRRDRMSRFNLDHGLTYHNHHVTEEEILSECKVHENDPIVITYKGGA